MDKIETDSRQANASTDAVTNTKVYDTVVVGGGIHGVSMANEATQRGLNTLLVQGRDIASGASANPAIVTGDNLRNLESFKLADVSSNLHEIHQLHQRAKHLVTPMTYHVLNNPSIRSINRVKTGLLLYKRFQTKNERHSKLSDLPKPLTTNKVDLQSYGEMAYLDYYTNTSRLIIEMAKQAEQLGAEIRPYHTVVSSERSDKEWRLQLLSKESKQTCEVRAKTLINCCGWLANEFLKEVLKTPTRCRANPLHSGHIYVRTKEIYESGFILQLANKLLVYATPFEANTLCIGPILCEEEEQSAKDGAIQDVLKMLNQYLETEIKESDIIYTDWCTRAKLEDPMLNDESIFVDSLIDLNNPGDVSPLLNVFGINPIQHRKLAEQGLDILEPFTGVKKSSNREHGMLPGGNINGEMSEFISALTARYANLNPELLQRLAKNYGSTCELILKGANTESDLGIYFGHTLYEAEVTYLIQEEWAKNAKDILWHRTYLGLHFTSEELERLEQWIIQYRSS